MTRRRNEPSLIMALVLWTLVATGAAPAANEHHFDQAEARLEKDEPAAAKEFSSAALSLAIPITNLGASEGADPRIRCSARAGVKGVPIRFELSFLDDEGEELLTFDESERTRSDGWTDPVILDLDALLPTPPALFFFTASADPSGGKEIDEVMLRCAHGAFEPCERTGFAACIGDRFQVTVDDAAGLPVPVGGQLDPETFFFFDPGNVDLLVKALNHCSDTGHFWISYGATTGVEFTVTVTDTESGVTRKYHEPQGAPTDAVTDVTAFATCP